MIRRSGTGSATRVFVSLRGPTVKAAWQMASGLPWGPCPPTTAPVNDAMAVDVHVPTVSKGCAATLNTTDEPMCKGVHVLQHTNAQKPCTACSSRSSCAAIRSCSRSSSALSCAASSTCSWSLGTSAAMCCHGRVVALPSDGPPGAVDFWKSSRLRSSSTAPRRRASRSSGR